MAEETLNRFERRKLRTRQQLKEAAVELILEIGYDSTTVQDITDRADLGRGTFYVHFKDKEDIVWTILQDSLTGMMESIRKYIPSSIEEVSGLYHIYTAIFRYAESNRAFLQVALGKKGNALLTARIKEYAVQQIQTNIQERVALQVVAYNVPIECLARYKAGALIEVLLWWLNEDDRYTPEEIAEIFYRIEMHGGPPIGSIVK
ncbi:MAG: TetR/AcrR family transcriptional regulator [Anaerolineae bacterium]|nr:TetR/AcrR family transcriptional regulator [Anaerolineae bacterium]